MALLLNLEMAATALLGVLFFREHLGAFGWAGIVVAVAAGVVIAVPGGLPGIAATLLVAGACLAWGLDNHVTALLDGLRPAEATVYKGAMLDQHTHEHAHSAQEHIHSHRHDDGHHDHTHLDLAPHVRHTHRHTHEASVHAHRHLPDLHHRHRHGSRGSGT